MRRPATLQRPYIGMLLALLHGYFILKCLLFVSLLSPNKLRDAPLSQQCNAEVA